MTAAGGRLRLEDGLRVASVGLRARPLRAALSALGIAIGTAAIVGVLGCPPPRRPDCSRRSTGSARTC